jgi:hypothetical protein
MEKEDIIRVSKYISIIVMLCSAISVIITAAEGYLSDKDYGSVIIAFGVFIVALRNYLKDKYGLM